MVGLVFLRGFDTHKEISSCQIKGFLKAGMVEKGRKLVSQVQKTVNM